MKAYRMAALLMLALPGLLLASPRPPKAASKAPTLQVTNQNPELVNVSLMMHGEEYTLGAVNRHTTRVFTLPSEAVGSEIRVVASTIGDQKGFTSQPITLAAGHRAELVVPKAILDSRLTTK